MKNIKVQILLSLLSLFTCLPKTFYANPPSTEKNQEIKIEIRNNIGIIERSNVFPVIQGTLYTESNIIEIQGEHLEDVQISIVDDFGSIMMETNQNISHKSVIKLNDNLPSGKYYLIIESEYYHGEGVFYLN